MSVRTYYVQYTFNEEDENVLTFTCLAENESDAKRQCEAAYPGEQILSVHNENWLYTVRSYY